MSIRTTRRREVISHRPPLHKQHNPQQALSVEVAKNESRILEAFDLKETYVIKWLHA